MKNKINLICPAAGLGRRLQNHSVIKPLVDICGKSMIERVCENLYTPDFNFVFCLLQAHEDNFSLSKLISKYIPDAKFVLLKELTEGPAITASKAIKYIDKNPLIVVNCDQIIEDLDWCDFVDYSLNFDGVVGTFDSDNLKNSFARTDETGLVVEIREKQKVGEHALNGVHFWKNGLDFLWSVDEMVTAKDTYKSEYFVSRSYWYLIKNGAKIATYKFDKHFPIGIPEDLEIFRDHLNEQNNQS